MVVALWDDSQSSLRRPAKQDLRRGLAVILCNLGNNVVLEQSWGVACVVPAKLDERLWAVRGVRGDGDALLLCELEERGLDEVGVVLDLEDGGDDLCAADDLEDQGAAEVGDTNALGEALLNDALESGPGAGERGLDGLHIVGGSVIGPAWWVADLGVDVAEGDREVDIVEVEVVDLHVCELAADNGLDAVVFGKGSPELGDDEEVGTLDEAVCDGFGETGTRLLLVAII